MMRTGEGSANEVEHDAPAHWLDLVRVRLYGGAMLFAYAAIMVVWACSTDGFRSARMMRPGADFSVFWSASWLLRSGAPVDIYDYARLQPVILAHGSVPPDSAFYLPWLYPPMFLWFVLPLALMPFALSYVVFVAGSGAAYAGALLRWLHPRDGARAAAWIGVLAFPGIFLAATIGQNALLTAALAAWGLLLLPRRPLLAGMLLGMLTIKPQLALVFPLALLAGREWRALAGATASALLLALASVAAFGWDTVPAFVRNAAMLTELVLHDGMRAWYASPTALSMARLAGGSPTLALALQAVVGLGALAALARVWSRRRHMAPRAAAAAVAALLSSPYLWYYELAWLGIAIAALASDGARRGWLRGERPLLVLAWLLPMLMFANALLQLWQCGVVVLMLLMAAIVRRASRMTEAPCRQPTVSLAQGAR